jgi:hypothetical protein
MNFLTSASQVARIISMSHWALLLGFLYLPLLLQAMSCPADILTALVPYHMQLTSRRDSGPDSRSSVQGSIVCMCSKDGSDYHKRCKDYVKNSLQICTFSKPSCFALQNHIMFLQLLHSCLVLVMDL